MQFILKKILLVLVLTTTVLSQGCSSFSSDRVDGVVSVDNLLIAEPLPVNFKSEIAIARLTEVINKAQITEEQKAQLFYDRGVLFDSVGLRSLARFDFSQALKLKPDLIDAYNFIGVHYTQLQEFSQAYESFDSVLDLSPDHEYAYLNRGIALYYGSRPELAKADFESFHQKQLGDPYRLLWLYIAEREIDADKAKVALKEGALLIDDRIWAKEIIRLYLSEISQNQFLKRLANNVHSNKELSERLCEAYFYLAKYNQSIGNHSAAANYFKLALSTNVFEFVEHRYAKLELDLMRVQRATPIQLEPATQARAF